MTKAVTLASSVTSGVGLVPSGVVLPFAGSASPTGWLLCDGSAVSRTTYADLFAAIGTTYGSGDGSSTFNLPGVGDRVITGKGSTKTTLGGTGGATAQTPSGTVGNTTLSESQMPSHGHAATAWEGSFGPGGSGRLYYSRNGDLTYQPIGTNSVGGSGSHNHSLSMSSMNVEQPFIVLNYIIKV